MESRVLGKIILFPLHVTAWVFALLPSFLRVCAGSTLGAMLRGLGWREETVRANLLRAYPGTDEEPTRLREALFARSYSRMGLLFIELFILLGPFRWFARRHCVLEGYENWKQASARGRGVLFLSSHVGNWELMCATGGLHGMGLMMVTKLLKPQWLHDAIERGRASCGVTGAYEPKTLRLVLKQLNQGGTVGFVLDQYAGPPVGVRVPFFGIPVGTSTAVATLAKRTGAAVVPVVNYRRADGKVVVRIEPALDWIADDHPDRELARNTARYTEVIEGHVREFPDQWLWTHRRFKGDIQPLRFEEWTEGRSRV